MTQPAVKTRRQLWLRVSLVVIVVLVVEFAVFAFGINSVRSEVLTLGYRRQITLLEDSGALARCDADPAGFTMPDRGLGRLVPLRPDGAPWASAEAVGDLTAEARGARPGEVVRVGSRWLAWPAVVRVDRDGPCQLFYLTPPVPSSGVPLLRAMGARAVLAGAIALGIVLLVVRPLTRRIQRLAQQTRALAQAGFAGRVDEGVDELGTIGAVINDAAGHARAQLDAEIEQRAVLHDLFADLAHDVRTPLASLKLSADALAHGDDPREVAPALRAEIEFLDAMFANLASMARLRANALPIERRPGDLRAVVEHVRDRFASVARDRGLALELGVPDEPVLSAFDPLTVEQALANVVHNAIKYARGQVAIVLVRRATDCEIRVLDDGPGIREAESARLTERRFRGADARGPGGLGLGLTITAEVMARHEGTLRFEPLDEGGTRVTLTLPAAG